SQPAKPLLINHIARWVFRCTVVVVLVGQQHMAQMAFAEHHDMIEAFPADRADQPFFVCVLPGSTRRRRAVSNADRSNAADKYLSVCTIAIPDQVSRDLLPAPVGN